VDIDADQIIKEKKRERNILGTDLLKNIIKKE
jgi:hypothetical protein